MAGTTLGMGEGVGDGDGRSGGEASLDSAVSRRVCVWMRDGGGDLGAPDA